MHDDQHCVCARIHHKPQQSAPFFSSRVPSFQLGQLVATGMHVQDAVARVGHMGEKW